MTLFQRFVQRYGGLLCWGILLLTAVFIGTKHEWFDAIAEGEKALFWTNVFVAGGTLLLALGTFASLGELYESRIQGSRPKIALLPPAEPFNAEIKFQRAAPHLRFIMLRQTGVAHESSDDFAYDLDGFMIRNVGFGPAFDVRVAWRLVPDRFEQIVNSADFFPELRPRLTRQGLEIGTTAYNVHYFPEQLFSVCAHTATSEPVQSPGALALRFLINFFFRTIDEVMGHNSSLFIDVHISYSDINRIEYRDIYRITPQIAGVLSTSGYGINQDLVGPDAATTLSFEVTQIETKILPR